MMQKGGVCFFKGEIVIKKVWIILISIVGLFIIYASVDYTVKALKTDYMKYNLVSKKFDSTAFEDHLDYFRYKKEFPESYPLVETFGVEGGDYKEIEGNQQILGLYEGQNNVLLTEESGSVTYEVEVSQAGFYRVLLTYYPYEGKSSNIERTIHINGDIPFESAENVVFLRYWGSKGEIEKDINQNDIRPPQEEKPHWDSSYIKDSAGYIVDPFEFYFNEGKNEIKFTAVREPMVIGKVQLVSVTELPTYDEILAGYETNGYEKTEKSIELYEAESPVYTTSPTLYPLNDRTSPLTSPSDPSKIKLNSIGGNNWRVAGDKIKWDFIVEESGLYEITMRLKQKLATGMTVSRNIYIDDEIPFKELENFEFVQSNDWRIQTLGRKKEAFLFYFEAGEHTITMEASLGQYGLIISEIKNTIEKLSLSYGEIIIYTGTNPDDYRDYQLHIRIPTLVQDLKDQRETLKKTRQALIDIAGQKSEKTGILDTVILQLDNFIKKPSEIHKKLSYFEENIASLGTLIILLDQQPLEIDYFVVHSSDTSLPRGRTSVVESIWYGIKAFISSFTINYASVGIKSLESNTKIDVWLSVGQDQANILRRLINEDFAETGIQVNLKLVSGAALLPATLSGNGPDVALGVGSSVPVNYAMRNAAYDLTQFAGFEELASQFHESALLPFTYLDSVYALPETQTFMVMFYRKDVFEQYGFKVPETWQDVYNLIPDLQNFNFDFYLPLPTSAGVMALPANPVFSTMFYQNDGEFYLDGGRESGFSHGMGPKVFEDWTRFYTDYSFVLDANFINRFRSRQMPIGLTYYNTYNTLAVFAPEIRGKWDFAMIPGTKQADGTIRRDTVSSVSGTMILKQTKNPEASWEFLQWWLSEKIQVRFGREMEGILGAAARYPTANMEAMKSLPWTVKEANLLSEQWKWTKGIPEVPGSYMTGRHLDNAFRKVIAGEAKPREAIYDYVQIINKELIKKRREFGLE